MGSHSRCNEHAAGSPKDSAWLARVGSAMTRRRTGCVFCSPLAPATGRYELKGFVGVEPSPAAGLGQLKRPGALVVLAQHGSIPIQRGRQHSYRGAKQPNEHSRQESIGPNLYGGAQGAGEAGGTQNTFPLKFKGDQVMSHQLVGLGPFSQPEGLRRSDCSARCGTAAQTLITRPTASS